MASFGRPRHLFGVLRSDVLMLSANAGGEQRRIAAQTREKRQASGEESFLRHWWSES